MIIKSKHESEKEDRGSSQFPRAKKGRGSEDDKVEDELMFDLDSNLEVDDAAGPGLGTPRHSSCRSRFPLIRGLY